MEADPCGDTRFIDSVSLPFTSTFCRSCQWNEAYDFLGRPVLNFICTGLVLAEFFQSVQTALQLKKSAGHIKQMNSKCSGTSLDKTLAGAEPKCKAGIWKCYVGANIEHTRGLGSNVGFSLFPIFFKPVEESACDSKWYKESNTFKSEQLLNPNLVLLNSCQDERQ